MPILSAPADDIDDGCVLGLGIKEIAPGQQHCGILYRPAEEMVRFLHLAFHFDLRDEVVNGTYWWCQSGLDNENQEILAALSILIAEGSPSIPYGFDKDGLVFDGHTGEMREAPPGKGLTCATFVVAVFRTYGFSPLLENSWESKAEDAAWQAAILAAMEANGASAEHVTAIRESEANMRFRPEEVVGAAAQPMTEWSIDYVQAQELAAEVLADMTA